MRKQVLQIEIKALLVIVSLAFLQACSTGKLVQTYEGEVLPNTQLATLVASENISLLSVNGKDVPTYLISSLETHYGIKPGKNQVLFKYESVWSKPRGVDKDAARAEKVESQILMLAFDAKAGEEYTFSFVHPENVREARQLANDISVSLYDASQGLVAKSELYQSEKSLGFVAQNGEDAVETVSQVSEAQDTLDKVEVLKTIWKGMSAKEKKAFLAWAFQD